MPISSPFAICLSPAEAVRATRVGDHYNGLGLLGVCIGDPACFYNREISGLNSLCRDRPDRRAFPRALWADSLSNLHPDKKPPRRDSWKWRYGRPNSLS